MGPSSFIFTSDGIVNETLVKCFSNLVNPRIVNPSLRDYLHALYAGLIGHSCEFLIWLKRGLMPDPTVCDKCM